MSNILHGKTGTSEFNIWRSMKGRCHNPKNPAYHFYGGRGIFVCDEWRDDFNAFFRDMGLRPSINHSIERIKNNLGYCKSNCCWATREEQNFNRRSTIVMDFDGIKLTQAEFAKKLNCTPSAIDYHRKRGKSDADIVAHFRKPKLHSSKYIGVYKKVCKSGYVCYTVHIRSNKKFTYIGCYKNEEDAALAYDKVAKELFGVNAKLNFK